MNKKLILIAFSVVMFSTVGFAQKVIKDKSSGAVIVDLSEMNPKFYTVVKVSPFTTATNSTSAKDSYNDISGWDLAYKKFEVHKTVNHTAKDWRSAIDFCANLDSNGKGWRLPRKKELLLIGLLQNKLVANGVSPIGNCWSATGSDTISAWGVYCTDVTGQVNSSWNSNNKATTFKVRCIRDL